MPGVLQPRVVSSTSRITLASEVADLLRHLAELQQAEITVLDHDGRQVAVFGRCPTPSAQASSSAKPSALVVHVAVPPDSPAPAGSLADFAAAVVGQVSAVREDLDLLSDELLERYEEVTLLHEVSSDLGVVLDVSCAAASALGRTLQAVPARFGQVLVRPPGAAGLVELAVVGDDHPAHRSSAAAGANAALRQGDLVLVNVGQDLPGGGGPATVPVLAVPLQLEGLTAASEAPPGVLVLVGHASSGRFSSGEAQLAATVARQLAVGLENGRLLSALREKERLEHELGLAASIQSRLLSAVPPTVVGATVRGVCLPAEQVGGDYYDFVLSQDGSLTAVVADVTGHGVGPALIMAMTRSVLRAGLQRTDSLEAALTATNATMWDDLLATGLFITVYCVALDARTRRLRFVNGGHHPALLRRADGSVQELDSDGMPIGLLPDPGYEQGAILAEPGSVLLLFSDGVVENRAPDGTMFGTPRLVEFLVENGEQHDLIDRLLEALEEHRAGGPRQDDVTIVELRLDHEDGASGSERPR